MVHKAPLKFATTQITSFVGTGDVLEEPPERHGCAYAHEIRFRISRHPASVTVATHLSVRTKRDDEMKE